MVGREEVDSRSGAELLPSVTLPASLYLRYIPLILYIILYI